MNYYDTRKKFEVLERKINYHESILNYIKNTISIIENLSLHGMILPITPDELIAWADEKLFALGIPEAKERGFVEGYKEGYDVAKQEFDVSTKFSAEETHDRMQCFYDKCLTQGVYHG